MTSKPKPQLISPQHRHSSSTSSSASLNPFYRGSVSAKPLAVQDCLKQMINFVKAQNLRYILGDGLSDEELETQLLRQAKIASQLPIKLAYVNRELVMQLVIISLYDLVVLVDDSMSMVFEQDGKRKEALKELLHFLADIYGAVSNGERGVKAIRFLNGADDFDANNLTSRDEINDVIDSHVFEGLTCIGAGLMRKILKPFVYSSEPWIKGTPRKLGLKRPLLVMVITDGAVEGEPEEWVEKAITSVVNALKASGVGFENKEGQFLTKGVVFQFIRVGDDKDAEKYLKYLDEKSSVRKYVDILSGSDLIKLMTDRETQGMDLTPRDQCRMIKLLLGPICESYKGYDSLADTLTGGLASVKNDFDFDFD